MKRICLLILFLVSLTSTSYARPPRFVQKYFANTNNVVWTAEASTPPNIATNYDKWVDWLEYRQAQFELRHPINRTTKYYFSSSTGDDADNCSVTTPCQSLTKLNTLLSASAGNVGFYLKRGDRWDECVEITINKPDVTVGAYGTGEKPILSCFDTQYLESGSWVAGVGQSYSIAESRLTGWVRLVEDFAMQNTEFIDLGSQSAVESAVGVYGFHTTGSTLYITMAGDDPSDYNIETSSSNDKAGVRVTSTSGGARIDSLDIQGYSLSQTTSNHNNGYAILTAVVNDQSAYMTNNRGYFTSAHAMGQLNGGGQGGATFWYNNQVGYARFTGGGATFFNTYNRDGEQETYFVNCSVDYGSPKESTWNYSANKRSGRGFYGHTAGTGDLSYTVVYNSTIQNYSSNMVDNLGGFGDTVPTTGDITGSKYFLVNNIHKEPNQLGLDTLFMPTNHIYYANRYLLKPLIRATGALHIAGGNLGDQWWINNYIQIDWVNQDPINMALYNGSNCCSKPRFWHSAIVHKNVANSVNTSGRWGIDYDVRFNSTIAEPNGTGNSIGGEFINSILSVIPMTGTYPLMYFSFDNRASQAKNSAFRGFIQNGAGTDGRSYGNVANKVELLNNYQTLDNLNPELFELGTNDLIISHDINGKRRVGIPDIGPINQDLYSYSSLSSSSNLTALTDDDLAFHDEIVSKKYKFRLAVTAWNNQVIYEEGGQTNGVALVNDSTGKLRFLTWSNNLLLTNFFIEDLLLNKFYEIEVILNGTEIELLVDGVSRGLGDNFTSNILQHSDDPALLTKSSNGTFSSIGAYADAIDVILKKFEIYNPEDTLIYKLEVLANDTIERLDNSDSSVVFKIIPNLVN